MPWLWTESKLVARLFMGTKHVSVAMLHGGFSGSLVLRTISYTDCEKTSKPIEAVITKLDTEVALLAEVKRSEEVGALMNTDSQFAVRVLRGPVVESGCAAVVLEVSAPCPLLASELNIIYPRRARRWRVHVG